MTPEEKGHLGGTRTAQLHGIEVCDKCGQILPQTFHQRIGSQGGKVKGECKRRNIDYSALGKMARGIPKSRI